MNPSSSSCPRSHAKAQDKNVPLKNPYTQTFINTLHDSVLFGGLGSLGREVGAMERQLASEARFKASSLKSLPLNDDTNTATMVFTSPTSPSPVSHTNPLGHTFWSKISNAFQFDPAAVPLSRYKITVEELPDSFSSNLDQSPNNQIDRDLVTTTTVAVMPSPIMDWFLKMAGEHPLSTVVIQQQQQQQQQPLINQGGDAKVVELLEPLHQPAQDKKDITSNTSPVITHTSSKAFSSNTEGQLERDLETAVAMSTEAIVASSHATKVDSSQPKMEQENSTVAVSPVAVSPVAVSPTVVNKVTHVPEIIKEKGTTQVPVENNQRNWPPRRRDSLKRNESFSQTTITRPDGTVESKIVTIDQDSGMSETTTRIQRPDGSIQETIQRRSNHGKPTWTTIHQRKVEQQQQQQQQQATVDEQRETEHESYGQSFRERLAQKRQEREEHRKEKQERRQELREAEARQRELTAAAYGFILPDESRQSSYQTSETPSRGYWFERKSRKYGRDEQNEGEEEEQDPHKRRHEFHRFHNPDYRSRWHQRRMEREKMQEQERLRRSEDNQDDNNESSSSYPKVKTWPPQGYRRRMEKEHGQDHEPRHNV
ncbi:hypothetical protein BGZ76_000526 [Entomortierella beljakovae]|nr:hypothetical protein BGZ76_000526 [Entomortierella beljakovae]